MLCSAGVTATAVAAPTIVITPHVDVLYDTNVARASKVVAEVRGLHRSDIRYTPALDFSIEAPLGRQVIFLDGLVGYDFYQRNRQLNRERIAATGGARVSLSRCSGTISGNLSRRQSEISDFIDVGPVKNNQTVTGVALNGRCGGPIGLVPTFGVSRTWVNNSNRLRDYGNSVSTSVSVGLSYVRPSFGELAVVGEYTRVKYPDRAALGLDVADGYDVRSVGGRFSREIGSRIGTSIGVFYTSVDTEGSGDNFSGVTGDAALDLRLGDATKLRLSAQREVKPSNLYFGNYSVAETYSAHLEHALSPRLKFSAGVGLIKRKIHGDKSLVPITIVNSERRYFAFARATYDVGSRAVVAVEVSREVRYADPKIFDYTSNRALVSLRYAFGRAS